MDQSYETLAQISPSQRILLLPHCLRQIAKCQAKYDQMGLQCVNCSSDCSVSKLRGAALQCGYRGVCVAPGGHLAIKYSGNPTRGDCSSGL